MPRFFFHVYDGNNEIDTKGTILEHDDEAREQAVIYASELLSDGAGAVCSGDVWRVDVQDSDGALIFRLDFSVTDALEQSAGRS